MSDPIKLQVDGAEREFESWDKAWEFSQSREAELRAEQETLRTRVADLEPLEPVGRILNAVPGERDRMAELWRKTQGGTQPLPSEDPRPAVEQTGTALDMSWLDEEDLSEKVRSGLKSFVTKTAADVDAIRSGYQQAFGVLAPTVEELERERLADMALKHYDQEFAALKGEFKDLNEAAFAAIDRAAEAAEIRPSQMRGFLRGMATDFRTAVSSAVAAARPAETAPAGKPAETLPSAVPFAVGGAAAIGAVDNVPKDMDDARARMRRVIETAHTGQQPSA